MRSRLLLIAAAAAMALAGAAAGASAPRISLLTQTPSPKAGSGWAYYLRATGAGGKPWAGQVAIEVDTTKGKRVDYVGRFAFGGALLSAYIWNAVDAGKTIDFKISLLSGSKTVASTTYRVHVR